MTFSATRMRLAIVLALAFACGCSRRSDASRLTGPERPLRRSPIKIAYLQDKTGSANWTRTPQLQPDQLELLIDLLRQAGGELGVGLIRDESNRVLVRLRVEPPPPALPAPQKTGEPFADARQMEQYRTEAARHRTMLARWQKGTEERIARFRTLARDVLGRRADARSTDLWGAVRRADLFLAEPDASWPGATRRWAVFATDGLHNRKASAPAAWKSGARVVVINGAAQIGCLGTFNPDAFESVEAAFRHLASVEGGTRE